jgi:hypothetical protein
VEVELGAMEFRGVLGDAGGGGVHLGAGPGDLGSHLVGVGGRLGEVGLGALDRELQVRGIDLDERVSGLNVGVVVH